METKKRKNLLLIIILGVLVVVGGAIGGFVFRVYFGDDYSATLTSDINLKNSGLTQGLVIKEARNVIVAQDDKIKETKNAVDGSILGIFKKITPKKNDTSILANAYNPEANLGQGLAVTSDGWMITNFKIDNPANYVVINKNKDIFSIEKVFADSLTHFYLLKIKANNLPVRKFLTNNEVSGGQAVVVYSWKGDVDLDYVRSLNQNQNKIWNSDVPHSKVFLSNKLVDFVGSSVFNFSGDVVGLIDASGAVEPIGHFIPALNSILKNQIIKHPSLGLSYQNISNFVAANQLENKNKGALIIKDASAAIVKGSPAEVAGLKEGDIITMVDDVEIDANNDLAEIITKYQPGDKINISYVREAIVKDASITLGELK